MTVASGKQPQNKPIILVGMGSYWPGAGANGPIKSLVNFTEALADEFEFRVVARDRPFGADAAQPSTQTWVWYDGPHGFPVLHIPVDELGLGAGRRLLAETPHDAIYLNGFFDKEFSIPLLAARSMQKPAARAPVIMAPRGEFAADLLAQKSLLKLTYILTARLSGMLSGVWFHATADHEATDLQASFPNLSRIIIASNIASAPPTPVPRTAKVVGQCRLVFSGRIARKNNLDMALDVLARVTSRVTFDICGPVEDAELWATCQAKIAALPSNIVVHAHGRLSQLELRERLMAADGMLQPTRGDNFGHAIVEAMQAGLPVIISDRTPWTGLEAHGVGWSLPLEAVSDFVGAVETLAAMDDTDWRALSTRARMFSDQSVPRAPAIEAHRKLFRQPIKARIGSR
jgi:glycosyltransferase involved in cell wall biosynthesis